MYKWSQLTKPVTLAIISSNILLILVVSYPYFFLCLIIFIISTFDSFLQIKSENNNWIINKVKPKHDDQQNYNWKLSCFIIKQELIPAGKNHYIFRHYVYALILREYRVYINFHSVIINSLLGYYNKCGWLK